jgi:hypothetical protein
MREKEGKGPCGPDHPQPEFLENGVAKGGVVRGLSGARTRDEGPEGRRAGARVDMQRLSGKRDVGLALKMANRGSGDWAQWGTALPCPHGAI